MKTYQVDENGYYGEFGGAYVPEILHQCVENLQKKYLEVLESDSFKKEFNQLLRDYVGRPSPLYQAKRLSEMYGCKIYLKREDLNHTGAHKINNTIGQILLARRMGKTRIIAETGAGQHGVATATVCALMNMECIVYMGKTDVERQHANVQKMEMLGATVIPVTSGNMTLKDATNEAIRDWCCHPSDTYYIIGSTVGPHPYPDMVARLQSVISEEIKKQLSEQEGRDYPDYLIACVGGGSNAAGTIYHFIDDERVKIVLAEAGGLGITTGQSAATIQLGKKGIIHGARTLVMQNEDGQIEEPYSISAGLDYPDYLIACVGGGSNAAGTIYHFIDDERVKIVLAEAGGLGITTGQSAATIQLGKKGIIHGARTLVMQNEDGQIEEPYSISAGLDYPGIGPIHANLSETHRATILAVNDDEALDAAFCLTRIEGIIPALESAHALGALPKIKFKPEDVVVLTISGRGDKDMETYIKYKLKNEK